MDLHKFALQILSQIYKNWGVNICKHGKCQSFTELFTPPVFWYANMALTIFAIYLLFGSDIIIICYVFATYLQGARTYLGTCTCLLVFNVCMPDIIQGASRWLCRTIVLFKSVRTTIELHIPQPPSPSCVCATNTCAPVVSLIQLSQV